LQTPPGSLPTDDRELCYLAGLSGNLAKWGKVKRIALRHWQECDDGRLYHPVVAELVLDSYGRLSKNRDRTAAATEARRTQRNDQRRSQRNGQRNDDQLEEKRDPPLNPPRKGGGDEGFFANGFKHVAAAAQSVVEVRRRELESIGWNRAMKRADPDVPAPRSADEIAIVEAEVAAVQERITQKQGTR
jgi:hypothetical protein